MQLITEHKLELTGEQKIVLPFPGALLAPRVVDNEILFWYVAHEDADDQRAFIFYVVDTGQLIPDLFEGQFWQTVHIDVATGTDPDDPLWIHEAKHLFIRPPGKKPIVARRKTEKPAAGPQAKSADGESASANGEDNGKA